jgi:hypothetical protein
MNHLKVFLVMMRDAISLVMRNEKVVDAKKKSR